MSFFGLKLQFLQYVQEAHATEGLGQVRTDLDQLVVLTSGNVPTDVAALLASPQKGRWGSLERKTQDSDPTTPLGGQAFSVFNEDVSPVCQTSNWEVHQTRTAQTLPSSEHSHFHFHSISSSGTKYWSQLDCVQCPCWGWSQMFSMDNSK